MRDPLTLVMNCAESLVPKVRYVFDTLFLAGGIPVTYAGAPPWAGPWLFYGCAKEATWPLERCISIAHCPESWRFLTGLENAPPVGVVDRLPALFPKTVPGFEPPHGIPFDVVANAFCFLASWWERGNHETRQSRQLYANSIYYHSEVPQNVVDLYLLRIMELLNALCHRLGLTPRNGVEWLQGTSYAVVLSHDVDFIPNGFPDIAKQGAKTVLRHLLRQADAADAVCAAVGLARAGVQGRDPYGCVPEIIKRERAIGARASFQVAVGHRHPKDVNYRIEDDRIRDYLRAIPAAEFEVCLHGSYRSTENREWYIQEVALLTERLCRPLGSRQHFLSFDYDSLFSAQEQAGIQYDMSMGFPDRTGPRAGFSFPYFPYCIDEDRPYDVLEISLFLMDVTLRSYMGLKGLAAWNVIKRTLDDLRRIGGCVSVVWHPIVFGGARDPGYDRLFWNLVTYVTETGGLATDGRTINAFWRRLAGRYSSFALANKG